MNENYLYNCVTVSKYPVSGQRM